jgi:hypothetical protein
MNGLSRIVKMLSKANALLMHELYHERVHWKNPAPLTKRNQIASIKEALLMPMDGSELCFANNICPQETLNHHHHE